MVKTVICTVIKSRGPAKHSANSSFEPSGSASSQPDSSQEAGPNCAAATAELRSTASTRTAGGDAREKRGKGK